jgi:hypothetical protein
MNAIIITPVQTMSFCIGIYYIFVFLS